MRQDQHVDPMPDLTKVHLDADTDFNVYAWCDNCEWTDNDAPNLAALVARAEGHNCTAHKFEPKQWQHPDGTTTLGPECHRCEPHDDDACPHGGCVICHPERRTW